MFGDLKIKINLMYLYTRIKIQDFYVVYSHHLSQSSFQQNTSNITVLTFSQKHNVINFVPPFYCCLTFYKSAFNKIAYSLKF
jgi:hypothetical protein